MFVASTLEVQCCRLEDLSYCRKASTQWYLKRSRISFSETLASNRAAARRLVFFCKLASSHMPFTREANLFFQRGTAVYHWLRRWLKVQSFCFVCIFGLLAQVNIQKHTWHHSSALERNLIVQLSWSPALDQNSPPPGKTVATTFECLLLCSCHVQGCNTFNNYWCRGNW